MHTKLTFLATAATFLALAASAGAATTISVDPVNGSDTNSGSATAPLKTLTKAVSLAHAGDTIKLGAGNYGPGFFGNGESFGSGLGIPDGVTIEGAVGPDGRPAATVLGEGFSLGLVLRGDATIRNLAFGADGFHSSITASRGRQRFENLLVTVAKRGVGNPEGGVHLEGDADATIAASEFRLVDQPTTGVFVSDHAVAAFNGVTVKPVADPNCRPDLTGVKVEGFATATFRNFAAKTLMGPSIAVRDAAHVAVDGARIARTVNADCPVHESIAASGKAVVGLNDVSTVTVNPTALATASVFANLDAAGALAIRNSAVTIAKGPGVSVTGPGTVTIDRTAVASGDGVAVLGGNGKLTVRRSRLDGGDAALSAGAVRLRESTLAGRVGVVVPGGAADLGTAADPGRNDFSETSGTGVAFIEEVENSLVSAVGNTWRPKTQASDAKGRYTKPLLVTGTSPIAKGRNFTLNARPTVRILLAAVGAAQVTPRQPSIAGVMRLKVRWTHPESWKRLRSIAVRLRSGGKRIGAVLVKPRSRRATAKGAIRLLRARVSRHGRAVTARLKLRVPTTAKVRVRVVATDRDGNRQGAGTARVLR